MIFSCDEPVSPTSSRAQHIVDIGWSETDPEETQSGEREFIFRLKTADPHAELLMRFKFPEPKNARFIESTEDETIIFLEGDENEYRLDHWKLLEQADRYRTNELLSLDDFKSNKDQQNRPE
jgi:hypothetical protein